MKFKANKYYRHTTGRIMHTLKKANTMMWGKTLIAEDLQGLTSVGTDSDSYAINWRETTKAEWLKAWRRNNGGV